MRLKDTGLTAQELKDIVNKYMIETYERYDFIAERAEGSCIRLIIHIQFRRHFWQRKFVIPLEWIRYFIRIPAQKRMNV